MDPVRRRTLQSLGPTVHFKRPAIRGAYCQCRGVRLPRGSRTITLGEHSPVRSIPGEGVPFKLLPRWNEEVARAKSQEPRTADGESDLAKFLVQQSAKYEKLQQDRMRSLRVRKVNSHEGGFLRVGKIDSNIVTVDAGYIKIGPWRPFHPVFLRDACECEKCIDPSSKQKNFQTTDIPRDIKAASVDVLPDGGLEITWQNDIPGFESNHKSVFSKEFFFNHSNPTAQTIARFQANERTLWNKDIITKQLETVDYEEYMKTDEGLFRAVRNLHSHGLLLIRGVPESEKSVEEIASRIGNLRDSLYGRTWDVKSIPQAKNVAYTAQFLGLHMDLLYMADPPGFQFLHCLQNSCEGGSSLFSDAMYAASELSAHSLYKLTKHNVAYHYKNAGEHYYYRHPVIEVPGNFFKRGREAPSGKHFNKNLVEFINYSPPFQANHVSTGARQETQFPELLNALREFASLVESEENLYEYRLQEGECVIFNNRRVLHGRRQFDTGTGSRWLKGAYIDTDVFMSKYRVLSEKFMHLPSKNWDPEKKKAVDDSDLQTYIALSKAEKAN